MGEGIYQCGRHGLLTAHEIAQKAGIGYGAVWHRINKLGLRGSALVDGTKQLRRRRIGSVARTPSALIACKLADAYPDRVPTWQEVRKAHPMCEQAAKRWSRAMEAARRTTGTPQP